MKFVRLYTDDAGESHFEDMEETFFLREFAPPAPAVHVTKPRDAERLLFVRISIDWKGGWHPAPKRQVFVCLSGKIEITASDGESRLFLPGNVILAEDTSGRGHKTKVIGEEDGRAAIIQLE